VRIVDQGEPTTLQDAKTISGGNALTILSLPCVSASPQVRMGSRGRADPGRCVLRPDLELAGVVRRSSQWIPRHVRNQQPETAVGGEILAISHGNVRDDLAGKSQECRCPPRDILHHQFDFAPEIAIATVKSANNPDILQGQALVGELPAVRA